MLTNKCDRGTSGCRGGRVKPNDLIMYPHSITCDERRDKIRGCTEAEIDAAVQLLTKAWKAPVHATPPAPKTPPPEWALAIAEGIDLCGYDHDRACCQETREEIARALHRAWVAGREAK